MRENLWLTAVCATTMLATGCQSESDGVAEVAREAAQRQAEQSKQMVQLQNQVAEGSRRLVEAEAQARAEMAALQRDLQQSQNEIGRQRDQLEAERRQIAAERYWDAILGNGITAAAGLVACLLPLVLCWVLLRRPTDDREADQALAEFLVQELASDHPALLPEHLSRPLLEQMPRCTGGTHDDDLPGTNPASGQS
jgi:hypothetical protein